MFARKVRVDYEDNGERKPCPLKWLDSFSMRNFTNAQLFDDTLPVADGQMEIGARVPLDELKAAMEDWFRKKNYLPKSATLRLEELPQPGATVIFKSIPNGFLDDLPKEDQDAIVAVVGRPVLLTGYDADGRAELQFDDAANVTHYIYVDPTCIVP